jgi:hypothetical protein
MTFRGSRTLALMCWVPDCEDEAEVLVLNDEFPGRSQSEWCMKHYLARVTENPSGHSTDCLYKLVRMQKGEDLDDS